MNTVGKNPLPSEIEYLYVYIYIVYIILYYILHRYMYVYEHPAKLRKHTFAKAQFPVFHIKNPHQASK